MMERDEALGARGATVVDQDGDKIGTVADIYVDRETDEPEWMVVKAGMLGTRVNLVPLKEASVREDDIVVPYDKARVQNAPSVEGDGELSQEEEQELYAYYGLDYSRDASATGLPQDDARPSDELSRDETTGRDTSGPTTDDAMTRSEEEVTVGKTQREAGRARLKKYVVTEEVTQTVPVQREEVRVEREPITEANVGRATEGPDISEEEHEVVLTEEEPVVEKRTVPKERVRLSKDTVTEEHTVSEDIRKEQIESEGGTER
jgi:uncharacterized protein (TIGR02271 family)